jgi:exosortase
MFSSVKGKASLVYALSWASAGILFAALYGPHFAVMARRWASDEGASHGFLIPVIAAWLVWSKRRKLVEIPKATCAWGLIPIVFGVLVTVAAVQAEVAFLPQVAALVVLGGAVLYAGGKALFKEVAFPYAFLYFMVPWPDFLVEFVSFPLQLLTSTYTAMLVGLFGVPVRREGVDLHMPGFSLTVAAACSGLRSLVTLMALASLFAYFTRASLWKRLLLFFFGIPVALIANVVRVTLVAFIGLYYDQKLAVGLFHDYSGPVLFLMCTLAMTAIQRILVQWQNQGA